MQGAGCRVQGVGCGVQGAACPYTARVRRSADLGVLDLVVVDEAVEAHDDRAHVLVVWQRVP